MAKTPKTIVIQPRFRLLRDGEIAFGPGKAALLEKIAKTGSIAKAAKSLDMSYMRAWLLLKTMERCFKKPLVERERGGSKGGGARVTPTGKAVLQLYRQIEQSSLAASKEFQKRLTALVQ